MKSLLLKMLAIVPIPVVILLIVQSLNRPMPPAAVLKKHGHGGGAKAAFSLPKALKAGWKVHGKVEQYDKKTLFDRINGAAPSYINAGFAYSVGAEFRKPGLKESVVADLYAMGTPARALGMYATERDSSYTFVKIGAEGYSASGSLNFWHGQFYVKLAGFEEGAEMDRALDELARGIVAVLPAPDAASLAPLGQLKLLTSADRKPNSEGYSHMPLADVNGLGKVYYAEYGFKEESYKLFIVRPGSPAEVSSRFGEVKAYFEKDGAKIEASAEGKIALFVARGDSATTIVARTDDTLAGGIDLTDPEMVPLARAKILTTLKTPASAGPAPAPKPLEDK